MLRTPGEPANSAASSKSDFGTTGQAVGKTSDCAFPESCPTALARWEPVVLR
jgi:hypothetical protein